MKIGHFLLCTLVIFGVFKTAAASFGNGHGLEDPYAPEYVMAQDTFPIQERFGDFINDASNNPFDLNDPGVIEQNVEYDPATGYYIITETIDGNYYRPPTYLTFEEYYQWQAQQQQQQYFDQLNNVAGGDVGDSGLRDPMGEIDVKKSLIDRLFGGSEVDIRPQGKIGLTFGVDFQKVENPSLTLRQQRQGGFDFDMDIQLNVTGKIGEKLNLATNYNTQATFDFDNQLKLQYDSEAFSDDDIVKKIEAGNVSFPLNSSLIQGSNSLFGIRTDLQFGHLGLSLVASQQKSRRQELQIQGGSQLQEFEVRADEYDENRHFFITHYNRNSFEKALVNLPQINTLFRINRIEVWVTNDRNDPDNVRDIVALADLGESLEVTNTNPQFQIPPSPRNPDITGTLGLPGRPITDGGSFNVPGANDLYSAILNNNRVRNLDDAVAILENVYNLRQSRDFEKVSARKLSSNEFTYHPELGFISLNVNLQPDQVLGVSMEYDYNGKTYRVGEFANDTYSPDSLGVLFVKMLKATTQRVDLATWDLMMKNVYSVGAFQVSQQDFKLDIFYEDPGKGEKRFLPDSDLKGVPLLQVFNLDNLNVQGDPCPDGIFDFVPGITINPRNGRIMFPVLEPFSTSISDNITSPALKEKYDYFVLYDSTVVRAREYQELNRFTIEGSYKSSVSSEISLGSFNLPPGSVTVRAGGQILVEGVDYEVDYNIGRIKILNDAYLSSGLPINVSFEDNTLFGFQTKTMLGVRADYEVNENFNIGATYLHLFERPFTQKVNIGDDPINNRIYGLDVNFSTKAPWLTRAVDAIPFINTKEESNISISAEAAVLKPGHARAINQGREEDGDRDRGGVVYIDDFEGSTSSFDLRTPANNWVLASVPQNDDQNNNPLFPESTLIDTTLSGVNRALLNWYRIDQSIRGGDNSDPYTAAIPQTEVFPNVTITPGLSNIIQTLDLTYYPGDRGPYNFDVPGGTPYSAGLNNNGGLNQPETRWAGIMRALNTNDFQAANIEYIEFWMLDPFLNNPNNPGDLYINLGNISEDILRDSRKFFENGLPTASRTNVRTDQTGWSRIPRAPQITNAFVNDPAERAEQDVGLDGLNDEAEADKFSGYLNAIQTINPAAVQEITADPSNDNYIFFRDQNAFNDDTPVLDRYRRFNMPEGNTGEPADGRPTSSTNLPDSEDINRDNTLSETEAYYQYKIPLRNNPGAEGLDFENNPYVTDRREVGSRVWYRFKVPLDQWDTRVGSIQDFRSIRFIRMYVQGFEDPVTLRFARFELVRNQWRRYLRNLSIYKDPNTEVDTEDPDGETSTVFDVNAVNIEENSEKIPFGYILPPGIDREQSTNTTYADILQNEQSLSIELCGLQPDDARAIYKNSQLDMRLYDNIEMFVHAEASSQDGTVGDLESIPDGDLAMMMRIGSDFENNYYEYEIPLVMSKDTSYGYNTEEFKNEVWKPINEIDIPLERFKEAKILRNTSADPNAFNFPFEIEDIQVIEGETRVAKIRVKGNPNLGNAKGIMVGIINRSKQEHCAEIWINELRLKGLSEQGGFAAIAKVDMQLADFGTATLAGSYSTIGWGGLEQKLAERSREEVLQLDAAASAELGKFFGDKSGIKIPFFVQYSQTTRTPQFDPYDLDVPLDEKLAAEDDPAARDSLREQAIDFTEIKGYNFTNVRKERTNTGGQQSTPKPWNIENFSLNYAYTKTTHTDPIIAEDEIAQYNGGIDYKYSRQAKYITPFKKLFKKDKYIKLLTEFNFNPLPNSFTFNTVMNRQLQKTSYRFTDLDPKFTTFYNKQFTWDRNYDMQWDLAKSLKISFNALNYAVIDELKTTPETTDEELKNAIWDGIRDFGRTKNYSHNLNVNYTLPFKYIPMMDWISVKAQYRGDYTWSAAALNTEYLGNVIQNGQRRQLNADLNFENLYNKSKFLKSINSKKRRRRGSSKPSRTSRDGADSKGKTEKEEKDKKGKKKSDEPSKIARTLIRPLMLLRKVRATYSENFSTIVPGYRPQSEFFGQAPGFDSPGWDFVAGLQPRIANDDNSNDWLNQGAAQGWFVDTVLLNQQVLQNYTQTYDVRVSLEPIEDFRLDLEANKSFTENTSLYFKDTIANGIPELRHVLPRDIGSYSISYFAMNTLFDNDIVGLFQRFEANRSIISQRLAPSAAAHEIDGPDGFKEGYGKTQIDVLIPSFLAAYTNKDANNVKVSQDYTEVLFKELPRPNWNLSYDGLSKIEAVKEIFSKFTISHGYNSTLTVNSFNTDSDFRSINNRTTDLNQNYFSRFEIPQIVIQEQFSPLIGVQMELQNGISMDLDFRKSRNLQMSFITYQLSETKTSEYTFGLGYTLRNVNIGFLTGNKPKSSRGGRRGGRNGGDNKDNEPAAGQSQNQGRDMNIEFQFSLRDDITINHLLDQGVAEPTRGLRQIQFSPSVDYDVNDRLNVRFFFDFNKTTPKTSASFPITNTRGGITVTFSLN
jgi:cell surface protein SprA